MVSARRLLRLNSSRLETFGTTKQAASGRAERISSRLTAWIVMLASPWEIWVIGIPASRRMRSSSAARSGRRLGGAAPSIRSVMGPSKRVRTGRARPLSSSKCSEMKSAAMLAFEATGARPTVAPKLFIGGRVLSAIRARVGTSSS